jgi:hypothetical protein
VLADAVTVYVRLGERAAATDAPEPARTIIENLAGFEARLEAPERRIVAALREGLQDRLRRVP